jgi:hypothetical protein
MHHRRLREDRVEALPERRDRLRARAVDRGPQVTLSDHVIIRVIETRPGLPLVGAAHREDRFLKALLT